jgi:LemA protein
MFIFSKTKKITMKKRFTYLLVVLASTFLLPSCSYNALVSYDEGVKKAWADVEASYQRRSDLIGNLVETVKGEAKFEKETLVAVIEARSKATSIQLNADDITPENMAEISGSTKPVKRCFVALIGSFRTISCFKSNTGFF